MVSSLQQQRAIITGASSGIGKATALKFAEAGCNLVLVARSSEKLTLVAEEVSAFGVEAKIYPLDLSQVAEVQSRFEAIAQDSGPIDFLINNAGMGYTNLLRDTSITDWQQVLDLNLTSIFQATMGVLPSMRDRKQGTIIHIASIAANIAFPNWGAYCVSKAALVTFAKVLAIEERENGIRVMTISPGSVNTPIWDTDTVQADFDRALMLTPDIVAQTILQAALLPLEVVIDEMTIISNAGTL
ncbi:MAG: SDR family oxidoreductase [Snowella sp.]|nr:SDR family oxidoreductase [Snowella sp.]